MFKLFFAPICVLILVIGLSSCNDSDNENAESIVSSSDLMIQQIGDSMASIDESSGNTSGAFAAPNFTEAACSTVNFGTCGVTASGTMVKNFGGCTVLGGLVAVSGSVALTYVGTGSASCTIPMNGDSVTRIPAFTATLPASAGAYFVSALSTGQTITRTVSETFSFSNTGIRRIYTSGASSGTTVADITTSTTTDIIISGTTRVGRVINAGTLVIANNLTSAVCTVTPNNVAWTSSGCACPTSGTWTGACSSGEAISMAFTSTCGSVQTSFGAASKTLTLENCN